MAAQSEASEAEPTTRDARFIKTAVEILRETGRTDFTVQEVVARSKTSLRAFYQRVRARRGAQVAIIATARKLACLCWQLLACSPVAC